MAENNFNVVQNMSSLSPASRDEAEMCNKTAFGPLTGSRFRLSSPPACRRSHLATKQSPSSTVSIFNSFHLQQPFHIGNRSFLTSDARGLRIFQHLLLTTEYLHWNLVDRLYGQGLITKSALNQIGARFKKHLREAYESSRTAVTTLGLFLHI